MTELEFIDIFGDNLRDLLIEIGINQNQLSKETGISRTTINRYVNKQLMPSLKNVINICYCFDCNIDDLIPTYDKIK